MLARKEEEKEEAEKAREEGGGALSHQMRPCSTRYWPSFIMPRALPISLSSEDDGEEHNMMAKSMDPMAAGMINLPLEVWLGGYLGLNAHGQVGNLLQQ